MPVTSQEYSGGGQLTDSAGRKVIAFAAENAAPNATDFKAAGRLFDVNGREVLGVAAGGTLINTGLNVNAKDPAYGAVGDGVTDDTAAIQAALNAARTLAYNNKCRAAVVLPPATYKVNGTLTVDEHFVSLLSTGARLDCTSLGNVPAILVTGTSDLVDGLQSWGDAPVALEGFTMLGPGLTTTSTGISYQGAAGAFNNAGGAHSSCNKVAVRGFGKGVEFTGPNAYSISFYNCDFYYCGIGINFPFGGVNGGEALAFYGCRIFLCSYGVINASSGATLLLFGCSVDYCRNATGTGGTVTSPRTRLAASQSGRIHFIGCWLESDDDTDWWFSTSNNQVALLAFTNCEFNFGGSKSVYEVFNSDANSAGIILTNCFFHLENVTSEGNISYSLPTLATGTGPFRVLNCVQETGSTTNQTQPAYSRQLNRVAGGLNTAAEIAAWTQSGATPVVLDTTTKYEGAGSAHFPGYSGAVTQYFYKAVSCLPGQTLNLTCRLYAVVGAGGNMLLAITFQDEAGTSLSSTQPVQITASQAGFIPYQVAPLIAPARTSQVSVSFQTFGPITNCWVDDVIVNVT